MGIFEGVIPDYVVISATPCVIPAKAGIQYCRKKVVDPRFHGDDKARDLHLESLLEIGEVDG